MKTRDFSGSLVVKTLPSSVGDTGLIPGQGAKIPHAAEQQNLWIATTEPTRHNYRVCTAQQNSHMMQWRSCNPQQNPMQPNK